MANLLTRYGIVPDMSKRYSISFVDDFLDCSYRSFLKRFVKIYEEDIDLPRTFGTGCHKGLRRINKAMKEGREYCRYCEFDCKLSSPNKAAAMARTVEECKVKQILLEEFYTEMDSDFERKIIEKGVAKGKPVSDIITDLENHKRYALNGMCSALFQKQPIGEVLLTEQSVFGKIGEFDMIGVIDLVLGIKGKSLVLDYKTAASAPTSAFPLRQLAVYVHLLEQLGFPVNGVGALYMLKKDPPTKPRKNSKPFKQTELMFLSVDKNRSACENAIKELNEDIISVHDSISNGCFLRNRGSMYCPCSAAEYCNSTAKLEKYIAGNPPQNKPEDR